jgi:hypothetical protein
VRLACASGLTFRQSIGASRFERNPIPSGSGHVSGKGTSSVIGQQIARQSVDLNNKERNGL